ncbi:MAG: PAS domain-containing sensor histidine kinase [Armatimonadota bacterium]
MYVAVSGLALAISVVTLGLLGIQCLEIAHKRRVDVKAIVRYAGGLLILALINHSVTNSLACIAYVWVGHSLYVSLKEQNLGNNRTRLYVSLPFIITGLGYYLGYQPNHGSKVAPYLSHLAYVGSVAQVTGCLLMATSLAYTIRAVLIPRVAGYSVRYPRFAHFIIALIALVIVLAPYIIQRSGQNADADYRQALLAKVSMTALAIDAKDVSELKPEASEVSNPNWQIHHAIVERIKTRTPSTRYSYLLRSVDGTMRFLADSASQNSSDFLVPGTEYDDVPQQIVRAYAHGDHATVGPYTDKWGSWVTAAAPIKLDDSQKMVAMLCIDVASDTWNSAVKQGQLRNFWLLLSINGLLVFLLAGSYIIEFKEQQLLEATKATQHRQQQLEELVNNLPSLAFMKDVQGRYVIVNNNLCQLLARSREQIIGKRESELIAKKMGDEAEADDKQVINTGKASTHQFYGQLLPNDPRHRHFVSTKVPIFDEQNRVIAIIGLTQDLTEILETRETLTRVNTELEATLKSRRENYRQLRAVMDAMPNPVFTRDSSGYYLSANRAFEEFVGAREVDIIGRSVSDIWGPEVSSQLLRGEESFESRIESMELQAKLRRSDGEFRDMVVHKAAFYSDAGLLIGIVGLMTDITSIKLMEKELSVSEQRLLQIINSLSDWVWEADRNMGFVYISDRVDHVMGYQPAELIGKSILDLMLPGEVERMRPIIDSMMKTPSPIRQLHNSLRHKDGSERIIELTGVPVFGSDGVFAGYRGVARDVTERAQSQRHNTQLLGQLTALNEDLMDFVHITSHELKGPVRAIGSLVQMVYADNKDILTEESQGMLEALRERSQRLYKILDAYQQLAKVHTSFEETTMVNMEDLVHEVLSTINKPDGIDVQVLGHWAVVPIKKTQMVNALTNILINSITYMDKVDGKIRIEGSETDVDCIVKVIDNGPGIDPKYHKQVFQGFRRAQVSDQLDRTGVGLALVRRVIHAHGGRVGIDSEVEEGTTIWFALPKTGKVEGIWGQ